MPFAAPNKFDEENDPNNQVQNGQNVSGESTSFSTGVPGQEASGKSQKGSGQYTNIQTYLDANKPQASQMGTQVADKITGTGQEARDQIGSASQDFSKQVDQGTIKSLETAQADASGIVDQAKSQAYSQKLSDDQMNRFKEVSTAKYQGPQDFESANLYQPTQAKVQKTQQLSQMSETEPGRFQLLNEVFKRPEYSAGQKNLDNLLLQNDSGTKQKLADARGSVGDVGGLFSKAQDDARALAGQRSAAIDDVRTKALGDFTGKRDARSAEVEARLGDVKDHWADEYNQYANLLGGYKGGDLNLSREQAKRLELMNGQGIYNLLSNGADPKAFLNLNAYDAGKVVSKDEQAQLAALDQLGALGGMGGTNKYSNADLAGTMTAKNALDASRFGESARQADNAFDDYAKSTNFTGYGSNTQSYDNGLFDKGDVTRNASVSQSLERYLNGLAANNSVSGGTAANLNPLLLNPQTAIAPILNQLGVGGLGDAEGGAANAASYWSKKYAADDLYSKLLGALEGQGYKNRIIVDGVEPKVEGGGMKGGAAAPVKLPNGTIIHQK